MNWMSLHCSIFSLWAFRAAWIPACFQASYSGFLFGLNMDIWLLYCQEIDPVLSPATSSDRTFNSESAHSLEPHPTVGHFLVCKYKNEPLVLLVWDFALWTFFFNKSRLLQSPQILVSYFPRVEVQTLLKGAQPCLWIAGSHCGLAPTDFDVKFLSETSWKSAL